MRVTHVVGAAGFLILSASPGISAPTAPRLSSITHDHHIVILAKRWPDLEWLLKPFRILTSNTRPEFSIGRIDESVAETEERLIDKRFEPSRKPPDKSSPAPNPQPMILAGDITPIKEPSTALFNHDAAAHSEQDVVRTVEAHDQEAQFATTTTKNAVASREGSGLARPGGKKAGEIDALGEGNNAKAPKVGGAAPAHNAYSTATGTMGQSVDAVRHTQPYESNHIATPNVKAESSDITPLQPKIGPLNARIVDPGPVPQLGGPPKAANSRRPQGRKPAPSQPDNHLIIEETPLATGEAEASSKTDAPAPNTFMRNHEAVDVQDQVASSDIGAGRSNSFDGDIAPDTSTNTRSLNVNAARTVVKTEANHKPVAIAIGTGAVVGGLIGGGVGLAVSEHLRQEQSHKHVVDQTLHPGPATNTLDDPINPIDQGTTPTAPPVSGPVTGVFTSQEAANLVKYIEMHPDEDPDIMNAADKLHNLSPDQKKSFIKADEKATTESLQSVDDAEVETNSDDPTAGPSGQD